jgi:hypothetical protein
MVKVVMEASAMWAYTEDTRQDAKRLLKAWMPSQIALRWSSKMPWAQILCQIEETNKDFGRPVYIKEYIGNVKTPKYRASSFAELHRQHRLRGTANWTRRDGLPDNEGENINISLAAPGSWPFCFDDISGLLCDSEMNLEDVKDIRRACDMNLDCVGFAFQPGTKRWYPKMKNTGFMPSTATYSQK